MSAVFNPDKINSYKAIVSDVSDDDLMETVKQIEKSENVITPTPGLAPYDAIQRFQNNKGVAVLFYQERCQITTHLSI